MLLEQLRYSLANLGEENFNETEFENIANIITQPVYVQLADTNNNVASLTITAEGLSSRMSDAEGNISSLTQTVNGMTLSVSNGSSSSTIRLVANGVAISSQSIYFSGMVTFTDLSTSGNTTITGDNITTGTISAINIEACDIESSTFRTILSSSGTVGGKIELCYQDNSTVAGLLEMDIGGSGDPEQSAYRIFWKTYTVGGIAFAMKFESAGGISMETDKSIYMRATSTATMRSEIGAYISAPNVYLNGNVYINGELYTSATA